MLYQFSVECFSNPELMMGFCLPDDVYEFICEYVDYYANAELVSGKKIIELRPYLDKLEEIAERFQFINAFQTDKWKAEIERYIKSLVRLPKTPSPPIVVANSGI